MIRRLILLLCGLVLCGWSPVNTIGGSVTVAAGGLPTPTWWNGFENPTGSASDCAAGTPDDGIPADTDATGSGDCNSTVTTEPEGSETLFVDNLEEYDAPSAFSINEGWVRWQFMSTVDPIGNSNMLRLLGTGGDGGLVRIQLDMDIELVCDSFVSSDPDMEDPILDDTWYIYQLHWIEGDGIGDVDMELDIYTAVATPVQQGSQISCAGDEDGGLPIIGIRVETGNSTGEGHFDCVEVYDTDPGTPTTNVCNVP